MCLTNAFVDDLFEHDDFPTYAFDDSDHEDQDNSNDEEYV
jgi:hypothetical protein